MKYLIILLTFFLFQVSGMSQSLKIENNSSESDSIAALFRDYLIQKEAILDTKSTFLEITEYSIGMDPKTLHGVGYQMGNSIFKSFENPITFRINDTTSGLGYDGLVLYDQVFVNQIQFYNYKRFNPKDLATNFQELINKYYPTFHLDSTLAYGVKDANNEYAGEFKLEYKTLTREGCLVTDRYFMILPNDYYLLGKAHSCELVFVFYQNASDEYRVKYRCNGMDFEMYDKYYNLIHKGVVSEYWPY